MLLLLLLLLWPRGENGQTGGRLRCKVQGPEDIGTHPSMGVALSGIFMVHSCEDVGRRRSVCARRECTERSARIYAAS